MPFSVANKINIGVRLRELRTSHGLSQSQVARKIGVHYSTVSFWESGKRIPGAAALGDLAKLYNVTASYILYGDPTMDQEPNLKDINAWVKLFTAIGELGIPIQIDRPGVFHQFKITINPKAPEQKSEIETLGKLIDRLIYEKSIKYDYTTQTLPLDTPKDQARFINMVNVWGRVKQNFQEWGIGSNEKG